MIAAIGDNANTGIPPHPVRNCMINNGNRGSIRKITKFSGNALYWVLQISILIFTVSFNILCNPIVWFLLKTIFNVLTEVFVYLVLGVCSILISIITLVDDYYTKGRDRSNHELTISGSQIPTYTIKRFVERPIKEM